MLRTPLLATTQAMRLRAKTNRKTEGRQIWRALPAAHGQRGKVRGKRQGQRAWLLLVHEGVELAAVLALQLVAVHGGEDVEEGLFDVFFVEIGLELGKE